MAAWDTAFANCFFDQIPGVVAMTWTAGAVTTTANVQFFSEPALDSDGYTQIQRRTYRVQGLTRAVGALRRNATITLAGRAYRCVTDALDDGFGVSDIHLEALAAT